MSNKKAKIEDEFAIVRQYLLDCPHVSKDHPAVTSALKGMEEELKKRTRDSKLQQKFMNDAVTVEKPKPQYANTSITQAPPKTIREEEQDTTPDNDWEDITTETDDINMEDNTTTDLGKVAAKTAVDTIARFQAKVKSPTSAIAMAIHSAMRSPILGFECTGLPKEEKQSNGFAAPVRALKEDEFLPKDWEQNSIKLRYRKKTMGSLILGVTQRDNQVLEVALYPSNNQEPTEVITFPVHQHINVDSFEKARDSAGLVAPTLHYKALASLMNSFCTKFDLGIDEAAEAPYVDTTIDRLPSYQYASRNDTNGNKWDETTTPRIDQVFPNANRPRGDFGGDLLPGGLIGPGFGTIDPSQAGNLMGPGHPAFQGGVSGVGPSSGFGMKPRFDPFGPPGGPQDPDDGFPMRPPGRGPNGRKPGGSGDPNPDHLRPPNHFGNNMFM